MVILVIVRVLVVAVIVVVVLVVGGGVGSVLYGIIPLSLDSRYLCRLMTKTQNFHLPCIWDFV